MYEQRDTESTTESTTQITEIEATGIQLKPERYIEWSIDLKLDVYIADVLLRVINKQNIKDGILFKYKVEFFYIPPQIQIIVLFHSRLSLSPHRMSHLLMTGADCPQI